MVFFVKLISLRFHTRNLGGYLDLREILDLGSLYFHRYAMRNLGLLNSPEIKINWCVSKEQKKQEKK